MQAHGDFKMVIVVSGEPTAQKVSEALAELSTQNVPPHAIISLRDPIRPEQFTLVARWDPTKEEEK